MTEKSDFEKGLEGIQRQTEGRSVNENADKQLRDLEGQRERPEIFERVHERYLKEDEAGNFIRDE